MGVAERPGSYPYAGINRIRFNGSACASQAEATPRMWRILRLNPIVGNLVWRLATEPGWRRLEIEAPALYNSRPRWIYCRAVMTLEIFLAKLHKEPLAIEFGEAMTIIDSYYDYTPTGFLNGELYNEAGKNEGSCKLFAFAQLNDLTEAQTLACFGAYYREDVLQHPEGDNHANIRNFIHAGWAGVRFDNLALTAK